jgi:hypothetical protein
LLVLGAAFEIGEYTFDDGIDERHCSPHLGPAGRGFFLERRARGMRARSK